MRAAWQLTLTWGVLVGLGTGSIALVFAATVANAWFVRRRGLVLGILTAGGAAGQLVFLPVVASLAGSAGWQVASLVVAAAALAMLPLVALLLRDRPSGLVLLPWLLSDVVHPSMVLFIVVYGLDRVATVPPTVTLCRRLFGERGTIVFGRVFAAHQLGARPPPPVQGWSGTSSGRTPTPGSPGPPSAPSRPC